MTSRLPPVLLPYLEQYNSGFFTLITSVLGASSNWLLLRLIYAALGTKGLAGSRRLVPDSDATSVREEATDPNDTCSVILVSWLRDCDFWRSEAKRALVKSCWELI